MDKLEAEIAKAKREAADLRRRAEEKELEAKTLMRAAKLRPPAPPTAPTLHEADAPVDAAAPEEASAQQGRGGRQKGAISKQWRAVLAGMYAQGRNTPHTIEDVELLAESAGLNLQPGSTQARLKNYIELGYIDEHGDLYTVRKRAVERFELDKRSDPDNGNGGAT